MNVHLGQTFDKFVAELIASGLYQSQSEVIREGLRLLKEREDIRKLRLEELRREVQLGMEGSGMKQSQGLGLLPCGNAFSERSQ